MAAFNVLIVLSYAVLFTFFHCSLAQRNFIRVTSVLDEPYLTLRESDQPLIGNERYEGFVVDLAEIFARELNFTYSLTPVRDGMYGRMSKDGVWNGMIGELSRSVADVAIAPLTMTGERAEVVDFSSPFMEFQLRIVMNKDSGGEKVEEDGVGVNPGSYIFLRPFSGVLWAVIVLSILILVLLLYTIELYVPRKQNADLGLIPPRVRFCPNGIWGTPRTVSGRMLQIVFWIFIVVVTAAYIAAFTGDRIVDRMGNVEDDGMAIKSIEDLAAQTTVKYGVIRSGSTYAFFQRSWERLHRKMFAMMVRESGMVSNSAVGYERVRNGTSTSNSSYAFIVEGPNAEYMQTKAPCNLALAPVEFGPRRAFAVAVRNSTLDSNLKKIKDGINLVILRMRETEEMSNLQRKWFANSGECKPMKLDPADDKTRTDGEMEDHDALCLYNMAGIFYVLIAAILAAILVAATEITLRKPLEPRRGGAVELRAPLHPAPARDARNAPPTGNST